MHLELPKTNTNHFVAIDRQVGRILITVHRYSQMTRVWEIFSTDLHVTAFDHDVVCIELSVVRGVGVGRKYKTALDDDCKYLRCLVNVN